MSTVVDPRKLDELMQNVLKDFFQNDQALIRNDVSERSMCGALAIHFSKRMEAAGLDGYYVDPEFNRKQGGKIKTILDKEMKEVSITCDLIIHSRGKFIDQDNLLAIEMAKPHKTADRLASDRERLRALTKSRGDDIWSADGAVHPEYVCGYLVGFYLIVNSKSGIMAVEKYIRGNLVGTQKQYKMW